MPCKSIDCKAFLISGDGLGVRLGGDLCWQTLPTLHFFKCLNIGKMKYDWIGWTLAAISLIVNILQLRQNNRLKNQINTSGTQRVGANAQADQQTHSGTGHNVKSGGDVNIGDR